jgi:tetratricopeptide (TPR) repeat protein
MKPVPKPKRVFAEPRRTPATPALGRTVARKVDGLRADLGKDGRRGRWQFAVNMVVAGVSIVLAVFSIWLSCRFKRDNDRALAENTRVLYKVDSTTVETHDTLVGFLARGGQDPPRGLPAPAPEGTDRVAMEIYNAAWAAAEQGRNSEAVRLFGRFAALVPTFAGTYNDRGLANAAMGDTAAALRDFATAIEIDPHCAMAYSNRGNIGARQGRMAEALSDHNKAVEHSANREEKAAALVNRGIALRSMNRLADAARDYLAAIRLRPSDASIYYNLANAYIDLKELGKADSAVSRSVALVPTFAAAYDRRGNIRYDLNRRDLALADYNVAVSLDSTHAEYWFDRSVVLYDAGDFAAAESDIRHTLRLDPAHAKAWGNLGRLLARTGRPEEAKSALRMALSNERNLPEGGADKVRLWLSQVERTGNVTVP